MLLKDYAKSDNKRGKTRVSTSNKRRGAAENTSAHKASRGRNERRLSSTKDISSKQNSRPHKIAKFKFKIRYWLILFILGYFLVAYGNMILVGYNKICSGLQDEVRAIKLFLNEPKEKQYPLSIKFYPIETGKNEDGKAEQTLR